MSRALITESYLTGIANAIRAKLGVQDTYTPPQMAAAIESIPTGITPTGTKQITQNGTHDVTEYANANVNVQPNLQSKTVTQNGTITPDQGYDGLSSVVVNVSGGGGGGSIPTFLQHSVANDVLANSYYSTFTAGNSKWGNLDVAGSPTVYALGIKTAVGNGFSYDLGEDNHSVTIYAIAKGHAGGDLFVLGTSYALSTGNTIAFFTRLVSGINWFAAVWGNDTNTGVDSVPEFAVMTLAIDATAKKAYYYINGTYVGEKSFSNSSRIVRFNGSNSHTDRAGVFDYLYAGVVDGCESSATILSNQQDMLAYLSTGRIFIP